MIPSTIGASMSDSNQQADLESHALAQGRERFLKAMDKTKAKGEVGSMGAGAQLVKEAIDPIAKSMEQALSLVAKRSGVRHIAERLVPMLGADAAAFMTVKCLISEVSSNQSNNSLSGLSRKIAGVLIDELRFQRLRSEAPGLFDYRMKTMNTSNYSHRKKALHHTLSTVTVESEEGEQVNIDVTDLDITPQQKTSLGVWCLNHALAATGLFQTDTRVTQVGGVRKTQPFLTLREDTHEWLALRTKAMELAWPMALPMVEPPLPWAPGVRGGYRYALRGKYQMVRGVSKAQTRAIAEANIPLVYQALNAIQATPWKINPEVAEVLKELVQRGGGMAGVPNFAPIDPPVKPVTHPEFEIQLGIRTKLLRKNPKLAGDMSPELRAYHDTWRSWKLQAKDIKDGNHDRKAEATAVNKLVSLVNLYLPEQALYFVHTLDFRGRVYPIAATNLSPQGNDMAKGLLCFARGRALGATGRRYLAQHGASCMDEHGGVKFSQVSIAQRLQWVEDNTALIVGCAEDPMSNRDWMEADAPFQFLAFCFEWKRLLAYTGSTETFVSTLPCSQDGSCNGIQHFSAMLQDEIGGAAVNLVPMPLPQDIYKTVLGKVLDILEADAGNPALHGIVTKEIQQRVTGTGKRWKTKTINTPDRGLLALKWLTSGLVTRSFVKRPVMTYPYGSRAFGFAAQIKQYLKTRGESMGESARLFKQTKVHFLGNSGEDLFKGAPAYMANVIMRALESTVIAAAGTMNWLQRTAMVIAKQEKACVSWTVPGTGFPVSQGYMEKSKHRVKTVLLGKVYKPTMYLDTLIPHAKKQANAISPNVVHSLDAAALMMAVGMALQDGVESFAMVHDSYGAPAGDCEVLARATRAAFVGLYTRNNVVERLHQDFLGQTQKALMPPPQKGTLDLSQIMLSDYFFA